MTKGAVLDIHVHLADGRHVDVEMQAALHPGLIQRIVRYWARVHGSQLSPGDGYGQLRGAAARAAPAPRLSTTMRSSMLAPA